MCAKYRAGVIHPINIACKGLAVTLVGVLIGAAVSLALSRVMAGCVYGIQSTDPLTYAAAAIVLLVTALVACYVPARRAIRIAPMQALRID